MRVQVDPGAYPPERAYETDAGLDLKAAEGGIVRAHSTKTLRTGVHVELPPGTCGLLVSKSGLMTKKGLFTTGLVDEGYSGEIMVTVQNFSDEPYMVFAGDKISQLVVIPVKREPIDIVSKIDGGDRGDNGFGSTGV